LQRHLTTDTDRLPAISGIAILFQTSFRSWKHMAGLWIDRDDSLALLTLLWVAAAEYRIERSKSYYLPSWSWAILPSPIVFLSDE
jgi:hypothetical protein